METREQRRKNEDKRTRRVKMDKWIEVKEEYIDGRKRRDRESRGVRLGKQKKTKEEKGLRKHNGKKS